MDRAKAGEIMESCLADEDAHAARLAHARVTAEAMRHVGDALHGVGSVLTDDATRGLGLATRMGGALGQGTCDLLDAGNSYAAAGLTRQLVEIEYLLWTFADDPEDCARWLNASRSKLERDFKPAAIRKRSDGRFRSREYRLHCEIGGHPSARGWFLLSDRLDRAGWVDLGQHLESAWALLVSACKAVNWPAVTDGRAEAVERARVEWHEHDALARRHTSPPEETAGWEELAARASR